MTECQQLGILVVDDEPFILSEMSRALSRRWSHVLQAASASEAVQLAAANPDIAVLVTDMRMPGEDGLSLAHRILADRAESEATEVVLMSGHAIPHDLARTLLAAHMQILSKPFRLAELQAAVTRAHDRAYARRAACAEVVSRI